MAPLLLRSATPFDASGIAAVQIKAWRQRLSAWAPAWFVASFDPLVQQAKYAARLADPSQTIWIAEKEGHIVGVIAARPNVEPFEGYDQSIYGFYVDPLWERQGIGRALLRRLLESLDVASKRGAIVFTFEANLPARRCYEACGGQLLSYTQSEGLADLGLAHVSYGFSLKKENKNEND